MSLQRSILLVLALLSAVAMRSSQAASMPTNPVRLRGAGGTDLAPGQLFFPTGDAGVRPGPGQAERDLTFQTIAAIYPTTNGYVAFGDSDHDLKNEAVLYVNDNFTYHYRVLENEGDNQYSDEYSGAELIPYALGDFDGDGLTDLVGQEGDRLYVYESVDAHSYPTRLAWTSPPLMNVEGFVKVADTDGDGKQEFIYSYNPFSGMSKLYIFENTGNDAYSQVYVTDLSQDDNTGEKVIGDLDRDGKTEIAMCGLLGRIYVLEAYGNNQWRRVSTMSTGLFNAYACEGGVDTDGNGKVEFFVSGSSDPRWCWETQVIEAGGDNLFHPVAYLDTTDGYLGIGINAMGDLDGTPPPEFFSEGNSHFWIWRATGIGSWEVSQTVEDPLGAGHVYLQCQDVNANGKAEIFWDADDEIHRTARTLVLEAGSSAGLDIGGIAARGIRVAPNPSRGGPHLILPAPAVGGTVSVFDVTGRLRARGVLPPGSTAWDSGDLSAGIYWLRIADARGSVTGSARAVIER
jgi:hypothetical protein